MILMKMNYKNKKINKNKNKKTKNDYSLFSGLYTSPLIRALI